MCEVIAHMHCCKTVGTDLCCKTVGTDLCCRSGRIKIVFLNGAYIMCQLSDSKDLFGSWLHAC